MRVARIVFVVAGIWGIVVLTPFYWLVDVTGRRYDPPAAYPHFFGLGAGIAIDVARSSGPMVRLSIAL